MKRKNGSDKNAIGLIPTIAANTEAMIRQDGENVNAVEFELLKGIIIRWQENK